MQNLPIFPATFAIFARRSHINAQAEWQGGWRYYVMRQGFAVDCACMDAAYAAMDAQVCQWWQEDNNHAYPYS